MTEQVLTGKVGLVFGVANKRSIAWAIAKAWAAAGAHLIFNYQGERLKENVEELVGERSNSLFPATFPATMRSARFLKKCERNRPGRFDVSLACFCSTRSVGR
jgi:enoyl-[acyl-carrier-protein] reductase (NADH)